MPVGSATDRNYEALLNGTTSTNKYNAVFSNEDKSSLDVTDFMNLMITQMTNQDFLNPTDNTEYMAQLAQFSSMQEMQKLAEYSKPNYAASLIGQTVTVAKNEIGGDVSKSTGVISSVSLVNNEFTVTVEGKSYSLNQIMQIHDQNSLETDKGEENENAEAMENIIE